MFEKIGTEVGKLVDEKQAAYGDSFGKAGSVMRILYPNGISPDQLDDALTIVRVLDKLFRIANKKNAFGENPWKDIAGYGLLGTRERKTTTEPSTPDVDQKAFKSPEQVTIKEYLDKMKKLKDETEKQQEVTKLPWYKSSDPTYWELPVEDRENYTRAKMHDET